MADFGSVNFAEIIDYFNDIQRLNCLCGVRILGGDDGTTRNGIRTY